MTSFQQWSSKSRAIACSLPRLVVKKPSPLQRRRQRVEPESRAAHAKKGRLAPALKHLGIECTLALGPGPFRLRGAGGLRNPSRESRPGPEATVICIAAQIDPRLTEFRLHYDSADEPVSAYSDTCAMMSHRAPKSQRYSGEPSCRDWRPARSSACDSKVTRFRAHSGDTVR